MEGKWGTKVKKSIKGQPENLLRNIKREERFMKGSGILHGESEVEIYK